MCAVLCDVSLDGFCQSAEAVDDTVFGCQDWAFHCWMLEDNCVVDDNMLGGVLNYLVSLVMLEQRADVESVATAEIPRASGGPLCM